MTRAAKQARDKGISDAFTAANERWKLAAQAALISVARRLPFFTSENIREEIENMKNPPTTHEMRALGAILLKAYKEEIIVPHNFDTYRRRSRHAAPVRMWKSKIFKAKSA